MTLDTKESALVIDVGVVTTIGEKIVDALKYTIYVFIAICLVTSMLGKVYAKRMGSDNVRAFGILFFSLYTWDFYSDIMFCVRLGDAAEWVDFAFGLLFILVCVCVCVCSSTPVLSCCLSKVPWLMNIAQLLRAQKSWTTDTSVQEGVRGWLIDWSILLMVAVTLSGNSFGAIELANSNLFGADLFSMGLNPRHLKEFQSKRFYSSVILES